MDERKNLSSRIKSFNFKPLLNLLWYLVLAGLLIWFLGGWRWRNVPAVPEINFSTLVSQVNEGKIEKIVVEGDRLQIFYPDQTQAISYKETGTSLLTTLVEAGIENPSQKVKVEIKSVEGGLLLGSLVSNLLPVLVMILFFALLMRQASKAGGAIFSFGRASARLFAPKGTKVSFGDVAGVDEAKQELSEVVDFLKNPEKYKKLGARIPKGVLLVGPAGSGKTLLAKAVAGEANVPFFSMAGSEFIEMLVGVGASRVRDLFSMAKRAAPSIIFIDELETIGRHRGLGGMMSHGEQEQTLNQILVEMDGFEPYQGVIVLGASNRPDLLDPALTRPGRFDRRIVLELPDIEGRKGILKIHMQGKPFASEVEVDKLAARTVGFSGADIENMLNEAAILAARAALSQIGNRELEEAATRVKMGPARLRVQSEEDKKMTAYHEAGHAIIALSLPQVDPVHRISIIARGLALGYTEIHPEIDRSHQTKSRLLEQATVLFGGRAAEELIFNEMTVGAGSDLELATKIARKMVVEFGMSDLGPVSLTGFETEDRFSGRWLAEKVELSQALSAQVDEQIRKIVETCFARAQKILSEKRDKLDLIATQLVQKETLEGAELRRLLEQTEKTEKVAP